MMFIDFKSFMPFTQQKILLQASPSLMPEAVPEVQSLLDAQSPAR